MKRFEELMDSPFNMDRFNSLVHDLINGKLVCFFGAGLSLGKKSKRWGYPFEWTNNKILDILVALEVQYKRSRYQRGLDELNLYLLRLADIDELCKNGDYLEAGDMLNSLVQQVHQTLINLGQSQLFEFNTFNEACVQAFREDNFDDIEMEFESPYLIPSAFYLPYLGGFLITTNVDETFTGIIRRLGISWHKYIIGPYEEQHTWEKSSVFYLHGNINAPDSLVMAKREYETAYPERIDAYRDMPGARSLLIDCAQNYSMLFLGASLQSDRTVDVINRAYKVLEAKRQNHYISISPANEYGVLERPPNIGACESIQYSVGQFFEIPILLLQLIRQTKDWQYCSWKETGTGGNENNLFLETKSKISEALSKNDPFIQIDLSDEDISLPDLLSYLYNQHSVTNHSIGQLGWSICSITHNDFTLVGAETFPLHNYPLGDTIYILADSGRASDGHPYLDSPDANRINDDIKKWRIETFPNYRNENGEILESTFSPRVRTIILELKPSYYQLEEAVNRAKTLKAALSTIVYRLSNYEATLEKSDMPKLEVLQLYYMARDEIRQILQQNENDSTIPVNDWEKAKMLAKRNEA